jgi:hypothetical protein
MKKVFLGIIILIIGFILYNNMYQITEKFNENNKIIKVFNFNTSWCGWSKKFQPEWDKFTQLIIDNKLTHIHTHDIKCDNDKNSNKCKEYNVPGYPYIVIEIITDANVQQRVYENERTSDSLLSYIKQL